MHPGGEHGPSPWPGHRASLSLPHPGYVCENGPEIEHPPIGRMRRRDAVVIPEDVLDEEGFAVDATQVLAVVEIVSPSSSSSPTT
ncbi:hypothetical protein [Streptomyces sp. NBC_00203]|uniref:hypothetical protein n=1 Tax=Streptomyces sp. NBC_00203 TaxID=2975680 RepID=UPI0032548DF1